ncbi:MAG: hypothetical protein M3O71_21540 [Bacteroidota bacterium]|nr:hypothetical protein [Bacteroidota bacterium]
MIKNFEKLKISSNRSDFQALVLDNFENLFSKINISWLDDKSFIEIESKVITIYLIHKEDQDTIVILNIFKKHISLWVGENNLYFDEDVDFSYLKDVYFDCLAGNYKTTDYYYKKRIVFSNTFFLNHKELHFRSSRSFFYFVTKYFFKDSYILKELSYKSFM